MAEVKMDGIVSDELRKRYPANDGSEVVAEGRHDLEPIDDISVERKPKGTAKKLGRILKGKDLKEVIGYVFEKTIFPGVRDIIFDSLVGSASMIMYGNDHGYSRTRSVGRTDYSSISTKASTKTRLVREASPAIERVTRNARTIYVDDLIFADRGVAYEVLDRLISYIQNYHSVSVANLYQLCKMRTSPTDYEWGWYDLNSNVAYVRRSGDKYILILPDPVPLTDDAPF